MSHGGLPTTAWMGLYAGLAGALGGLLLAVLWTPLLISSRVRSLFEVGPTRWLPVNYTLGFVIMSGIHAGMLGAWIESGSGAGPNGALNAVITLGVVVPVLGWVGALWGLPEFGYDWDTNGYDLRTKAALGLGVLWYAVMTIVPGFVASLIAAFPA